MLSARLVKQTKMWFWYSMATSGKSRIVVVDVLPLLLPNLIYMFARYSHARVPPRHIFTIISSRAFRRDKTTSISRGDNTFHPHLSLPSRTNRSIFLVFPYFLSETHKRKFLQSLCALSKARMVKRHFFRDARDFLFFHWHFRGRDDPTVTSRSNL